MVAELQDRIGDAVLIDKDDGMSGYYQWELHPDDRHFTGVYTPLGVRVFHRMPMAINVAPGEWNGVMAAIFGDLPRDRFFWTTSFASRQEETESREELELRHQPPFYKSGRNRQSKGIRISVKEIHWAFS